MSHKIKIFVLFFYFLFLWVGGRGGGGVPKAYIDVTSQNHRTDAILRSKRNLGTINMKKIMKI